MALGTFKVFERVYARGEGDRGQRHGNPEAGFQRAQLFERLGPLQAPGGNAANWRRNPAR